MTPVGGRAGKGKEEEELERQDGVQGRDHDTANKLWWSIKGLGMDAAHTDRYTWHNCEQGVRRHELSLMSLRRCICFFVFVFLASLLCVWFFFFFFFLPFLQFKNSLFIIALSISFVIAAAAALSCLVLFLLSVPSGGQGAQVLCT